MSTDIPANHATVGQPFTIAGWAIDLAAASGTGVNTVHIWAYPPGQDPVLSAPPRGQALSSRAEVGSW
jgi:hypothetical protein